MSELRKRRPEAPTSPKPSERLEALGRRKPAPVHVAEPLMKLGTWDWVAVVGLLLVCGFTRFWRLDKPPSESRVS